MDEGAGRRRDFNALNAIKHRHRFLTWNVLSLNEPGRDQLLARELSRLKVLVAGLQEVRWRGSGETLIGDYKLIWSGHESHRVQGVALAVHRTVAASISQWKPLGPRMLYARLRHTHGFFSLFSCYAPTNMADEVEKDAFFDRLQSEIRHVSRHDIVMVMGDLNATIGAGRAGYENVVGPFTAGPTNDNGQRTLQLAAALDLRIAFSWFRHKEIHRHSWYSNDGHTRKTLDHILYSRRWNVLTDCRVFRSAELGNTDHRPVVASVQARLKSFKPTTTTKPRLDIEKLRLDSVASRYAVTVANSFAALDGLDDMDVEESWNSFQEVLLTSTADTVGKVTRRRHNWISARSLQIVEDCRAARLRNSTDDYRRLTKERRRSIRRDKRTWCEAIADKADRNFRLNDTRSAYQCIRELCDFPRRKLTHPLLDPQGNLLTSSHDKRECWRHHFENQLNRSTPTPDDNLRNFAAQGNINEDIRTEPPTPEELMLAIRKLDFGKSPGPCGITSEMLKAAGQSAIVHLCGLCQKIWEGETVPNCWRDGTIIPVYKGKGDPKNLGSYRPITLLSVPAKVVTSVILRRLTPHLVRLRRPEQAGFTPCRSTVDCILALRILAEQHREFRRPLFAAYIDLKAAFDSVDRDSLWLLLQGIGIPPKLIRLLRAFYTNTQCCVKSDGGTSVPFSTSIGVRQGCVAAPSLFNTAMDYWMNVSLGSLPEVGADYHGRITDLCYADDAVLFAEVLDVLATALHTLSRCAKPLGMTINWMKTKIQALGDNDANLPQALNVHDDVDVDLVDSFVYLGSKISGNSSPSPALPEVRRRIALAHSCFGRMSRVWSSTALSKHLKWRLLETTVIPILMYGCETWTLSASVCSAIDAFHRKCLRSILSFRWFDRVRNSALYAHAGDPVPISTRVRQRRLQFLGHVARLPEDVPSRRLLMAASRPPPRGWRRPPGRPRSTWTAQVSGFLPLAEAMQLAHDRRRFRDLVATVT